MNRIDRTLLALVGILVLAPEARADDPPCKAEASAVAAMKKKDPALAAPTDKAAAEHHKAGNSAHLMAQYDEAIAEYQTAGKLSDAPVLLYNLGQAYRGKKEYETARRQYRLFLDRAQPGPEVRALVECHIDTMTAHLEDAAATAPPTGPAPDGDPVGTSDLGPAPASGGEVALPLGPRDAAPPWYDDPPAWVAVGAGTLSAGLGVVFFVNASSLDADADREDRDDVRAELRADADSRRTWGVVATGVGAVALAAGIVKLILTPDPPARDEPGLSIWIGSGRMGLAGAF